MRIDDAEKRLYDKALLIGRFRRGAAIKALAGSPDPTGVVALAEALGKGAHPNAGRISSLLLKLSAERDADKVLALWMECRVRPRRRSRRFSRGWAGLRPMRPMPK
ncbi:MAG: hypothetical protein ACRERU_03250 [Methylococcales bacterium]